MKPAHFILILFFLTTGSCLASKNQKSRHIRCIQSTYSIVEGVQPVGRIYEFQILVKESGCRIDSVWFGSTPVPCEVLESEKRNPVNGLLPQGEYIVRANKDLYTNYPKEFDKTTAEKMFKQPFKFKGDAVILYTIRGKRYARVVYDVQQVPSKKYRP
jgi:hypothetical protein